MKEQKDPINPTYYDEIFDKMMDNKFTKEQLFRYNLYLKYFLFGSMKSSTASAYA